MQHQSTAHSGTLTTPAEKANDLLDKIEDELDRLRRGRPQLEATIQKASNILTAHLAGRPRHQIVRVRTSKSGKPRFLFTNLSGSGATYVVDVASWSCTCPAAHRYEGVCKHGVAAFILWRVSRVADRSHGTVIRRDPDGCFACEGGLVRSSQPHRNDRTGVVSYRTLILPCKSCGGAG